MIGTATGRARRWAFLVLLPVASAAGCGDGPVASPPDGASDLSTPWTTADASDVGMDADRLSAAADAAAAIGPLRSFLVVRRGKIVAERYPGGTDATVLADVRSGTKSVVSTLVGIALERGDLRELDQPVAEILDPAGVALSGWQRGITLRHLVSMTGGFDWHESGAGGYQTAFYNEWILSGDPVGFLLDRPMASEPGSEFEYNSAAVHLLGVVLEEATGSTLPAYADRVLFGPLGIARTRWENIGEGRVNGGSGLDLRPRDLARLGQLMLQDGWSGDTAVVPAAWVRAATARRFAWTIPVGPFRSVSYGYLWWIDTESDAFMAWGFGGQFVYVHPGEDLVVVATTDWTESAEFGGAGALAAAVLGVIGNGVLQALS